MKLVPINKGITVYLLHALAWACFLIYPFITGMPIREDNLVKLFLNTCLLAVFFYVNTTFLIPRILTKGKVAIYFLIIGMAISLLVCANIFFNHLLDFDFNPIHEHVRNRRFRKGPYGLKRIVKPILSGMFIFAVSTSYRLLSDWFTNEREKKELENQNLISELSFLKSQVGPHFIFNTLNNIYSLSLSNSTLTSDAILRLSQLLRYMLYESNEKLVNLEKEIDYLENFIELQKMRLRPGIKIVFRKSGVFSDKLIAPMLLIPFIENAFKHGIADSDSSDIIIDLAFSVGDLKLTVINSIVDDRVKDEASGIGLQNVKRRLELLYSGRYTLQIDDVDNKYLVFLKLNLE